LEQLINQEESSKVKNFIETVEYLCKAGQKIENEELNNLLFSFKNKVTSFYKRLNGINSSIKEDSSEIVIDINKEQIKLVEIIAFIRDLEEKMKVNRVSLDEQARETKETEAQIVELDIARLN
jgi:hypothetical protein